MRNAELVLRLTGLRKSYEAVRALRGVSFDLRRGEVHALVGENGAGKSTLIKAITGAIAPDEGQIEMAGRSVSWMTPHEAAAAGIAVIYQQPALFPDLSVAENIALRVERAGAWRVLDWKARRARARALLERIGASIDPDRQVDSLSMPEQQVVEIAGAVGLDARIVIMDEPTASLGEREVASLFQAIAAMKAHGAGVIYISHRLEEIFALADRVTVLRDGESVGTYDAAVVSRAELVRLMAGRALAAEYAEKGLADSAGTSLAADRTDNADTDRVLATDRTDNADTDRVLATDRTDNADTVRVLATDRTDNADAVRVLATDRTDNADADRVLAADRTDNADTARVLATDRTDNADTDRVLATDRTDNADTDRVLAADRTDNADTDRLLAAESADNTDTTDTPRAKSKLVLDGVGHAASGVRGVTLEVRRGEVLGLAGLVGSGRTELAEIVFGLRPADAGTIRIDGHAVKISSPADAIARGIAYVPEDRRRHGVVLDMSIAANTTLASLGGVARRGLIDRGAERALAATFVERLQIKASSVDAPVATLSGGNQQKVALARWLATKPSVLILDEPTQGVDVGAKAEIHRLIAELAAGGLGILVISSELPELLSISDRIAVMHAGTIAGVVEGKDATHDGILTLAFGHAAPGAHS